MGVGRQGASGIGPSRSDRLLGAKEPPRIKISKIFARSIPARAHLDAARGHSHVFHFIQNSGSAILFALTNTIQQVNTDKFCVEIWANKF